MTDLFRRLPPLGALAAFDAAFRHGSFTRAGDELALSQASISRRVRELESDLGLALFERRRHDVVPTEHAEKLSAVLVEELGLDADKITADAKFEEDLEVDSLGVVELLMALEDNFGVSIPDEEAESIETVGQAVDLVHSKLDS